MNSDQEFPFLTSLIWLHSWKFCVFFIEVENSNK